VRPVQNQFLEFSGPSSSDLSIVVGPIALDDLGACVPSSCRSLEGVFSVEGTELSLKILACPLLLPAEGGVVACRCLEGDELLLGNVYIEIGSLLWFVKDDIDDEGLLCNVLLARLRFPSIFWSSQRRPLNTWNLRGSSQ